MGPAGRRWPLCGRGNNDMGERSGPHGCSPMAANRTETEELTVRSWPPYVSREARRQGALCQRRLCSAHGGGGAPRPA